MWLARLTCCFLVLCSVETSRIYAQSFGQSYTKLAGTGGFLQAVDGRKHIFLKVAYDRVNHADGSVTYSVGYDAIADDENFFGQLKFASELYNITYTIKYHDIFGQIITKSGNISLDHLSEKAGVLYDWTLCPGNSLGANPLIALDVTAQRYGGSNGITVSWHH